MTQLRLLWKCFKDLRHLPDILAWRMARWVRDVHESRYVGGPISDELVKAQDRESAARSRLKSLGFKITV